MQMHNRGGFFTSHERAAITSVDKHMCGSHKEAASKKSGA